MVEVLAEIAAFGAALLIHVLWWRIGVPKAPMKAFGLLFGGAFVAATVSYVLLADSATVFGLLYVAVLHTGLVAAYLLTYSAVAYDSPSLSLTYQMWEAGETGMGEAELTAFTEAHPFVHTRLAQLYRDGFILRREGRLALSAKGRRLLSLYDLFLAVLGRPTERS